MITDYRWKEPVKFKDKDHGKGPLFHGLVLAR